MNEDNHVDEVSVTSVDPSDDNQLSDETPGSYGGVERKPEPLHLKTKPIPAIVTLLGGSVVEIDVFIQQLDFRKSLVIILASLVVFLVAGEIVKLLLDRIELPNPDAVDADGNVIQKGKSGGDEESDVSENGQSASSETTEG